MERAKTSRRAHRTGDTGVADFLDVAGHELRAPLTALKGHAQFLHRRLAKQPDRASDALELSKMLFQIARIEHELDVYLEAARIFDGRFWFQVDQFDLVALVRRLVGLQREGMAEGGLRLEAPDEEVVGEWDRRKIQLVLGVLLANAAKYGLDREVVVRLLVRDGGVRVEVEDQGIGVPASDRRSIFTAYATGGNVENAGLGLGLYVAREMVRRHGGRIGVRARRGGGSIFWFELPLHASAALDERAKRRARVPRLTAHAVTRA